MAKSAIMDKVLELNYSLSELPTSQHKAGLVGLLLVIDEVNKSGVSSVHCEVSERSATIKITEAGLKELLDEVYSASLVMQEREAALKDVEPAEIREEKILDKNGKEKLRKVYVYPGVVPRGSFLDRVDESEKKVWVKLWRDMVWQILRGVPATRTPFEDRAAKKDSSDVSVLWKQLNQDAEKAVDLPSTYFIGAQAFNAEKVPFKDNGKTQFLLHFWPLVCQIYRPQVIDRDGKRSFLGYVIAVPDVAQLRTFKADFFRVLQGRTSDAQGFVPKDAVIEIAEESGLDFLRRIRSVVAESTGKMETSDLLFGIDIFHTSRDGNNVRLLFNGRIEPDTDRDRQYVTLKSRLFSPAFRRQRILNLVRNRNWYFGFEGLIGTLPLEHGLCSSLFSHDAKISLEAEETNCLGRIKMKIATGQALTSEDVSLEGLVLKIMDGYLQRKLKDKYSLEWAKINDDPARKMQYFEKRESLGKEVFYAIRSRSSEDFINYFASTICSVTHWMTPNEYLCITKKLYEDTEKIRTLSMLALSAKIVREKKGDAIDE